MDQRVTHRFITAAVLAATAGLLYLISSVLGPFLLGLVLAYLLHPLVDRLQNGGCPRWLSSLILVLVVLVGFIGFLIFFVPFVVHQAQYLLDKIPGYLVDLVDCVKSFVSQFMRKGPWDAFRNGSEKIIADAARKAMSWAGSSSLALLSNVQVLGDALFYLLVTPVITFFCLWDWPRLVAFCRDLIPLKQRADGVAFLQRLDQSMSGYLRGQVMVCLVMAAYLSLGFYILRFPYAIPLGMMTGVLVFLPYVGMFLGSVTALLLILTHDPSWFHVLGLVIVLSIGQVLEAVVFVPFFVGRRVGIHPAWVLFSVFASGAVFGGWGVLLAMPLAVFARTFMGWLIPFYKKTRCFQQLPHEKKSAHS